MIQATLRTWLLDDPAVAGLIGERLYPLRAPQGVTAPYVVYEVESSEHWPSLQGDLTLKRIGVWYRCFAAGYAAANEVAEKIKSRLVAAPGQATGIEDVHIEDEDEAYFTVEGEEGLFEAALLASVWTAAI